MPSLPYIFTFYSFKGGVGRSMALLNVAYALVARGRNVLILDMDLEAPGIAAFLGRNEELEPHDGADILKLIEWARDFCERTRGSPITKDDVARNGPDLKDFVERIKTGKLDVASLKPRLGSVGQLHLIGARVSDAYLARLHGLGLDSIDQETMLGMSEVLRILVKSARLNVEVPDYYGPDGACEIPYDYVLVDARTGFTEIGGLCVGPLADRVVVFTGLNDQNVCGTGEFMEVVGLEPIDEPAAYFGNLDPNDLSSGNKKPRSGKPSLVVATPVPHYEPDLRRTRLESLKKRVRCEPVRLSYHPLMALFETNFVRDYPSEYLGKEYLDLTERMMAFVGDHTTQLERQVFDQIEVLDRATMGRALGSGTKTFVTLQIEIPTFPILMQHAPSDGHIGPLPNQANAFSEIIRTALRIVPMDADRGELLLAKLLTRQPENPSTADLLAVDQACRILAQSETLARWSVYASWFVALDTLAQKQMKPNRDRLTAESLAKIEAAKMSAKSAESLHVLGVVLNRQSESHTLGKEADQLCVEAIKCYEGAAELEPESSLRVRNWAHCLRDWANRKSGPEADELFEQAIARYKEALRLAKDSTEKGVAIWCWGITLLWKGLKGSGRTREKLLLQACQKYAQAAKLCPENAEIPFGWGDALIELSKSQGFPKSHGFLKEAQAKYREALKIKPDYSKAKSQLTEVEALITKLEND
jgi:tetratricopeptide (TPR) repeat protein